MQWKRVNTGILGGIVFNVERYKNMFYLCHSQGLYTSTDGDDWQQNVSITGPVKKCIEFADTLYAVNDRSLLYSSDGTTWNQYLTPYYEEIIDFVKNQYYTIVTTTYDKSGIGSMYRSMISTNGGRTWDTLSFSLSAISLHDSISLPQRFTETLEYKNMTLPTAMTAKHGDIAMRE